MARRVLSRRSFLGMLSIGAATCAFRPDKWFEKSLPPPAPEVTDFTRIVVPMAFYSHVRKITLIDSLGEPCRKEEIVPARGWTQEDVAAIARQIADEIEFEVLREGYTPVA